MQGGCLRSIRRIAVIGQNRTLLLLQQRAEKDDDPDSHRESSPSPLSLTVAIATEIIVTSALGPLASLATS
jgi:hypothetical protein